MAKQVKPGDDIRTVRRGPDSKYDLDQWFNGEEWVLTKGEDFDSQLDSMEEHLRKMAATRNLRVSVKRVADAEALLVKSLGPIATNIKA